MSIEVPLSIITSDQLKIIQGLLILTPKVESWGKDFDFNSSKPEPIIFYSVANGMVRLPRAVGEKLFPTYASNPDIGITPFQFTGDLFAHQQPIYDEALSQLIQTGGSILNVYPGLGKTVLSMKMASDRGLFFAVLTHRQTISSQWVKTVEDYTTAKVWVIGERSPTTPIHGIICMNGQFAKLPVQFRDKIGFLILDEAHTFCTPSNVPVLLGSRPKYILASTATLERPDGMESMIYAVSGLAKTMRISTKPFHVFKFLTGLKFPSDDWNTMLDLQMNHPGRNSLVVQLISAYPKSKILILTDRVEHATKLHAEIATTGESVGLMAGKTKSYTNSRVLVGTKSKIGTGFDEKSACPDFDGHRIDLCILLFSTKQPGLLEQTVGRAFRSDLPQIIHFVDDVKTVKRHWSVAQKWYYSRAGTIFEWNAMTNEVKKHNPRAPKEIPVETTWEEQILASLNQGKI